VGLTVLQQLSGLFVGGATSNPLLVTFASLIALLLWLNLSAQVILIAVAYIFTLVREGEDRVRERSPPGRSPSAACSRRRTPSPRPARSSPARGRRCRRSDSARHHDTCVKSRVPHAVTVIGEARQCVASYE
jgi:hypothetical protein